MASSSNAHDDAEGVKAFFWMLRLAMNLMLWMILVSFLAVLANLIAAHFLWQPHPVRGMEDMVRYYLHQTNSPELAQKAANGFYWMWFGWTGIDQSAQDYAAGYISHRQLRQSWQHLLFETWREPLIVAMYSLKLLGIRASTLTMMLPQLGVALAAALVDGLVARHIRRACGGHESATRYHQAKNGSVFALIPLTALIWLIAHCTRTRHSGIGAMADAPIQRHNPDLS